MSTIIRSVQAGANPAASTYDPTKPYNEQIRAMIRSTHSNHNAFTITPDGKRFKTEIDPNFVKWHYRQRANDGIGTKGALHYIMGTERHGAKDAFWMVADDLIEGGYIPVSFEDHIQIQEENAEKIFNIVGALVALANQNGMAIVGGETAIINTLQGIEVGISGEGYVKKGHQIIKSARPGDVIIGIESDNLHSNGYTFVRDTLLKQYGLDSKAPWCNRTVGEELTVPTRGYLPVIKELLRQFTCDSGQAATEYASQHIHGMVHITGGGLSKLGELCPYKNVDISINRKHKLEPQEIFRFIQREFAIASEKMYTRFNNGIGYVMAVSDNAAEAALGIIRNYYPAEVIGNVTGGTGKITIESKYDSETVSF